MGVRGLSGQKEVPSGQFRAKRLAHGKGMLSLRQRWVTKGLRPTPQVYPGQPVQAVVLVRKVTWSAWEWGGWTGEEDAKARPPQKLLQPVQLRDGTALKAEEVQRGLTISKTWWLTKVGGVLRKSKQLVRIMPQFLDRARNTSGT